MSTWDEVRTFDDIIRPKEREIISDLEEELRTKCPHLRREGEFFYYCALNMPEVKDLVALQVTVTGMTGGGGVRYSYRLLDYYDEEGGITAMGRTTAYTASAVVQLLARGEIEERGIVPPEKLGMDEAVFPKIIRDLENDGVIITETVEEV